MLSKLASTVRWQDPSQYHDKTTSNLVTAGGTWSRYAPGDHTR